MTDSTLVSNVMLDRIEAALERHLYQHAPKRIPVDPTDSDVVLFDLRGIRAGQAWPLDEQLAYALAIDEGADPHHLIWEGNPPEPWGEVWQRYIPQARRLLECMRGNGAAAKGEPVVLPEVQPLIQMPRGIGRHQDGTVG